MQCATVADPAQEQQIGLAIANSIHRNFHFISWSGKKKIHAKKKKNLTSTLPNSQTTATMVSTPRTPASPNMYVDFTYTQHPILPCHEEPHPLTTPPPKHPSLPPPPQTPPLSSLTTPHPTPPQYPNTHTASAPTTLWPNYRPSLLLHRYLS